MTLLNGEMLRFPPVLLPHSMRCGGFVRLRADVGIGPYIRAVLRTIHLQFAEKYIEKPREDS